MGNKENADRFATMPSMCPVSVLEAGRFKTEFPPLAKELLRLKFEDDTAGCIQEHGGCLSCNCLFSAELSGGVPALTVSHGSGELFLQLSPKANVADRRWHNIKIINDGKASVNMGNPGKALIPVSRTPSEPLFVSVELFQQSSHRCKGRD